MAAKHAEKDGESEGERRGKRKILDAAPLLLLFLSGLDASLGIPGTSAQFAMDNRVLIGVTRTQLLTVHRKISRPRSGGSPTMEHCSLGFWVGRYDGRMSEVSDQGIDC